MELIRSAPCPRVLEIGVGTGNYLGRLTDLTHLDPIGVDPSIEMLSRARLRCGERVVLGRAERLPFSSASAGFVFSVDVVHHIEDRLQAACEARRVLQPEGTLVIATDREADIRRRLPLAAYFPDIVDIELRRYPTEENVIEELTAAGFQQVDVSTVSRAFQVTDPTPYEQRAFSSMHFLSEKAYRNGLQALNADLELGPIPGESHYTLYVASRGS